MLWMPQQLKVEHLEDIEKINNELKEYNPELIKRPQVIAANKTDIPDSWENVERLKKEYEPLGVKYILYQLQQIKVLMNF